MTRDRIQKLRAMAEHPTSNEHEAELARKEMERLKSNGVADDDGRVLPPRGLGPDDRVDCRVCGSKVVCSFVWFIGDRLCPKHAPRRHRQAVGPLRPGMAGYHAWVRDLLIGSRVQVCTTTKEPPGYITLGYVDVVRQTRRWYVMSDGSRFRSHGNFAGTLVGEHGGWPHRFLVRTEE